MEQYKQLIHQIIHQIKNVFDPELPINIYDMGLIYDISVDKDKNVKITMTVTAPNCPIADTLPADVKSAVENIQELSSVWVNLTFDPPWTPDRLSESAKLELGLL